MEDHTIEEIEAELTNFTRRIVLTEKQNGILDRSAYVILSQLTMKGPAGVKILSDELHLDISTISRQARTLVEKNYVEKKPDPADGRAYFHQITSLGKKELDRYRERRFSRVQTVLADWPEADREAFGRLLAKYNHDVEEKLNF